MVPGSITDRLRDNPDRQPVSESARRSRRRRRARSATRRAFSTACTHRGATRPTWRSTRTSALAGNQRATLRLEVINLFDNPWYAALASTAQGNANFGRVNAQANYSRTFQLTARYLVLARARRTGGWRPSPPKLAVDTSERRRIRHGRRDTTVAPPVLHSGRRHDEKHWCGRSRSSGARRS